jgi:hypothetical protein
MQDCGGEFHLTALQSLIKLERSQNMFNSGLLILPFFDCDTYVQMNSIGRIRSEISVAKSEMVSSSRRIYNHNIIGT